MTSAARATSVPKVRRPGFGFEGLPRRWLRGRLGDSHVANAANLLFPAGERFFVRSVRHYLEGLGDATLRRRVAALIGQEARHGLEHEEFFAALEAQGYDLAAFLQRYQRLAYEGIEPRTSPILRLATTAALEHCTAVLATLALRDGVLDAADVRARRLLLWHAAEEIEHRSVAFDVLEAVDPRYRTRLRGFLMALLVLHGFWVLGFLHLIQQDVAREGWPVVRELLTGAADSSVRRRLLRGVPLLLRYLRRDFHPDDEQEADALARAYLAEAEEGRWSERPRRPDGALAGAPA